MTTQKTIPTVDELGVKPLFVSWSRLHTWELCNQRAIFQMQKRGDVVKDGRRFIHGTLADRSMRRWLEQDEPQLEGQMASYIDDIWDEYTINSDEYKINWKGDPVEDQAYVRDLAKRVVNNVEPFLIKRVLPFEYEPEFRFKVPIQIPDSAGFARTIVLNGGMDIAVREPDRISLYDLKATTNEYYIQQGIMPQLIFYSIAWTLMFGTPLENIRAAFLTPACKVQYHELNIGRDDRRHLMTRIIKFANAIWDDQKPACTDDKNECWGCSMKKICPKWATPLVATSNGKNKISLTGTAKARLEAKIEPHE